VKPSILGLVALAAALTACSGKSAAPVANDTAGAPTAAGGDADAIKAVEAAILAGYKTKDGAKVAAQYADTAIIVVPGAPAIQGHDAIVKSVAESINDPAFSIDFTNSGTEVAMSGDLGYTHGTFRASITDAKTGKPVSMAGNYTTVFRKQADGNWKAINDIASSGG